MKRRNFLKIASMPLIAPATICSAKSIKTKNNKKLLCSINHDNIKIDGTFEKWINSIAKEMERLLAIKTAKENEFEPCCTVAIRPIDWGRRTTSIPAFAIVIYKNNTPMSDFSFAEMEFDRNRGNSRSLRNLLNIRFADSIGSLCDIEQERLIFLRKFGINYEMVAAR